ncbi:MAG: acyltransferase [Thermodesulfobacteriota bacterium]|nr:acyltransferase [Thermodesulfobacteriota bacterium]
MKLSIKQAVGSLYLLFITYLPGNVGIELRRRYYSKRLRKCGKDLVICTNVHINGLSMIEIGNNVKIRENVIIHTGKPSNLTEDKREMIEITSYDKCEKGLISIGNNSRIAFGAIMLGYGGIKIGENCGVGPGAKIYSESFHYKGRNPKIMYKYSEGAPQEQQCNLQGVVKFKDGAGVASNVIVLPGATIGKDSWVGPNSVVGVKAKIPDYTIVRGDPVRVVFKRKYQA